jgi:uncharacterized damage-inducible protein DinB
MSDDLRFPIGKFIAPVIFSQETRQGHIQDIADAPSQLRAAVQGLSVAQFDTPYRPGGWTLRQVVHHLPDSHLNSYVRFKLALTEEEPTIKPYDEQRWAELSDTIQTPPEVSLDLLESLHRRWVVLLRSLSPTDLARTFKHPESGQQSLERTLALYSWHGRHHIAHITSLRTRMGW